MEHHENAAMPKTAEEGLAYIVAMLRICRPDFQMCLSGYLTSGDPSYLPDVGMVRTVANHFGYDALMDVLISSYICGCEANRETK